MRRTYLGEFEEIVLLMVAVLDGEAYGAFTVLVIVAMIIASPIAWYVLSSWLQKYEYHTRLPWSVFVWTGLGALAIRLLTVSFQSIKAALMNPVKSLRTD